MKYNDIKHFSLAILHQIQGAIFSKEWLYLFSVLIFALNSRGFEYLIRNMFIPQFHNFNILS